MQLQLARRPLERETNRVNRERTESGGSSGAEAVREAQEQVLRERKMDPAPLNAYDGGVGGEERLLNVNSVPLLRSYADFLDHRVVSDA